MNLTEGRRVRIRKVSASMSPKAPSADPTTFKYGESNEGVSLPLGYDAEGTVARPLYEGFSFAVYRTKRNGVDAFGIFQTSKVLRIEDLGDKVRLYTENSVYEVELLPEVMPEEQSHYN